MATKTSIGWLILACALAVPGVLFYQWRTHLDLEKKRALTTKVRLNDTDLFRNSPNQDKLVNPIASAAASVAASTAAPAVSEVPPAASEVPPAPAGQTSLRPASPAPAEDGPAVLKSSAAFAANPFQAWRDPTLSAHDLVEIERLELERQLALQELKDRALQVSKGPPKSPPIPIETLIELQGIVSVAGRNKAIVNNDVVAEGEVVRTKAGPVKVLRITPQKVIFAHQNKSFFKVVEQ
jgi:hypothetical protein